MMRATNATRGSLCTALLCLGVTAAGARPLTAQISSSVDALLATGAARTSFMTMGGLSDVSSGRAGGAFGFRTGFMLRQARLDFDGGVFTANAQRPAASFGVRGTTRLAGMDAAIRLSAAGQTGDHAPSGASAAIELLRDGARLAFKPSVARSYGPRWRDTVLILEGDTTVVSRVRDGSAFATRMFTDVEGGYRYAWSRVELSGLLSARVSAESAAELSGSISAQLRVTRGISMGAIFGRDAANGVLGQRTRNASMLVMKLDAGRPTFRAAPNLPHALPEPYAAVSSDSVTSITVRAQNAKVVEVMGDFSDWQPIALTRANDGPWSTRIRLGPGVYQMTVRMDHGTWTAPHGLPSVAGEFGTAAVFVIPAR